MKKKDWLLIKILISVFISLILILVCFYRYNKTTNNDYIKKSKQEAFSHSYLNSQLFESRIKNAIAKLGVIGSSYFGEYEIIDEQVKQDYYSSIDMSFDYMNIYTLEEFNTIYEEVYNILKNKQSGKDIIYLYNDDKNANKVEIILPIYNYEGNIIGGISSYINQNEFISFSNEESDSEKFKTYIFDSNGDIIFGGHLFDKKMYLKFIMK